MKVEIDNDLANSVALASLKKIIDECQEEKVIDAAQTVIDYLTTYEEEDD